MFFSGFTRISKGDGENGIIYHRTEMGMDDSPTGMNIQWEIFRIQQMEVRKLVPYVWPYEARIGIFPEKIRPEK